MCLYCNSANVIKKKEDYVNRKKKVMRLCTLRTEIFVDQIVFVGILPIN